MIKKEIKPLGALSKVKKEYPRASEYILIKSE